MSGLTGRIAWQYGLEYGRGPLHCVDGDGELQGMLVTASRIGVWRTGGRRIEWFDHALRRLYDWHAPAMLRCAWAVSPTRWAAIVSNRLLILDEVDHVERALDLSSDHAWRVGCAVDAATICLAGDAALATIHLTDGSVHLQALPRELRRVCGLACHSAGRWLAMTHTGDNAAWLLERGERGRLIQLAGGLEPGGTRLQLHAPRACSFDGDTLWVADSNNNRVIRMLLPSGIRTHGIEQVCEQGRSSPLWRPTAVHVLGEGHLGILDTKNRRVVLVNGSGEVVASTGPAVITERKLHLPRSITLTAGGDLLVCDSHRDRIVSLRAGEDGITGSAVRQDGIAWPRHAFELDDGMVIVSAHASTLLRAGASQRVEPWHPQGIDLPLLRDPHQVVRDVFGMLVANSGDGEVIASRGGHTMFIREVLGKPLSDPHAADFTFEGGIIIADTGNDRLLVCDPSWKEWRSVHEVRLPDRRLALRQPRFVAREHGRHYLLLDTGSRLVLRCDIDGCGTWAFGAREHIWTADTEADPFTWDGRLFHDPRWVISPAPNRLIVSDTGNCRVVSIGLTYS